MDVTCHDTTHVRNFSLPLYPSLYGSEELSGTANTFKTALICDWVQLTHSAVIRGYCYLEIKGKSPLEILIYELKIWTRCNIQLTAHQTILFLRLSKVLYPFSLVERYITHCMIGQMFLMSWGSVDNIIIILCWFLAREEESEKLVEVKK